MIHLFLGTPGRVSSTLGKDSWTLQFPGDQGWDRGPEDATQANYRMEQSHNSQVAPESLHPVTWGRNVFVASGTGRASCLMKTLL